MKMKYVSLGLVASLLLLAACQTTDENAGKTTTSPAQAESAEVRASTLSSSERAEAVSDLERVGDRVFFNYDRYDLTPEARTTLDHQVEWMKRYPGATITVEGHADERGTREYNLALGEQRANTVRNYLIAMGVAANRVGTVSYGKERPAATGSNEAAWAQNRRGVTTVN